jgi:hypothetical protein
MLYVHQINQATHEDKRTYEKAMFLYKKMLEKPLISTLFKHLAANLVTIFPVS